MAKDEGECLHCLHIDVHLDEHLYQAWLHEAERQGATVEELVGGLVDELIREMEERLEDHPVWVS